RGPSFPSAANRFDLTSAGDISVAGDPAPKNKLIRPHTTDPKQLLQLVRLLHQIHRQVLRHGKRLVLIQPMLGYQPSQERAIDPPCHVMPRRDRKKRPRI